MEDGRIEKLPAVRQESLAEEHQRPALKGNTALGCLEESGSSLFHVHEVSGQWVITVN
jgi:hypothetical protein